MNSAIAKLLRPGIVSALLIVPLAAGCTTTLDVDDAETKIRDLVDGEFEADVKNVECPDSIESKKGGKFDCKLTATDGSTATIHVTQTDDEGRFVIQNRVLLHVREAERRVASQLEAKLGGAIDVTCPDFVEARRGRRVVCQAVDERGEKGTVVLTMTNNRGHFEFGLN